MSASVDPDIPRKLAGKQGLQWVNEGFRLYRRSPWLLSAAFGLLFGGAALASLIPFIGSLTADRGGIYGSLSRAGS
jgi:hypothetical protein